MANTMTPHNQSNKGFLYSWALANVIGWYLGCIYLGIILYFHFSEGLFFELFFSDNFNSYILKGILFGFPFGFCIGVMQCVKLRNWNIRASKWILMTCSGWGLFFVAFIFVSELSNLSSPLLSFGWIIITLLIGGMVIGGLQSILLNQNSLLRKKWMLANSLGLLALVFLVIAVLLLAFALKSIFLNFFYSYGLYEFVYARDLLLLGFLLIAIPILSVPVIGIPTGKILMKTLASNWAGAG